MTGAALELEGAVVVVVVVVVDVVDEEVVVVDDVVVVDVEVDVLVVVDAVVVGASVVDVVLVAGFGVTTMVPVIDGCTLQWYENVPGDWNATVKVARGWRHALGFAGQSGLESNEPSSAVTVWPVLPLLCHATVSFSFTVIVDGVNLKSSIETSLVAARAGVHMAANTTTPSTSTARRTARE